MRSYPSCWNRTLSQLGFKRKKRNSKKQDLHRRSFLFEGLEPRQMLSGDSLYDLETESFTTSLQASSLAANTPSEPEFVLFQQNLSPEDLDGVSPSEVEQLFVIDTVQTESGPQALLSINPNFAVAPPSSLQELRIELQQDGLVIETFEILVDIAEEDFRENFLTDRVEQVSAEISFLSSSEIDDWQSSALGDTFSLDFLSSLAKRQVDRGDVLDDSTHRQKLYEQLHTHTIQLIADRDVAVTEAELASVAEREQALQNLTLLLAQELSNDLENSDASVANAASNLRDGLVEISDPYQTAFVGLGVDWEVERETNSSGDERAVSLVETGYFQFSDSLEIDLLGQQAMVQVTHSAPVYYASSTGFYEAPVVEDGTIREASATTNGGTDTSLYVNGTLGAIEESLIRFNLDEVTDFTNPTTIASAALELTEVATGTGDAEIYIWNGLFGGTTGGASDWDETNLTWDHVDGTLDLESQLTEFTQLSNWSSGTTTEVDVTTQLQRALLYGDANGDGEFSAAGSDGDIEAFHLAVTNWDAYVTEYGGKANSADDLLARLDGGLGDGVIDSNDIADFFRRLGYSQGDYNLDGTVQDNADFSIDGLDWAIFNANYGLDNARFTQGDGNFDGVVDDEDFDIWFDRKGEDNLTPEVPEIVFYVRPADTTTDIEFASQEHTTLDGPTLNVEDQPDLALNQFTVGDTDLLVDYSVFGETFTDVKVQIYKAGSPDTLLHETTGLSGAFGSHEVSIPISALSTIVEGDEIFAKVVGTPDSGVQANTSNDQLDFEFSTLSTQVVNSLDDAGMDTLLTTQQTLRELLEANEVLGWFDTITFDEESLFIGGSGEINLGDHDLDGDADRLEIDQDITIAGPGTSLLTINGRNQSQGFHIGAGFAVTLSGLTVASGYSHNHGGGIYNRGDLILDEVVVINSSAASHGGGIYSLNGSTLEVRRSTIDGNISDIGGGISGTFIVGQSLHIDASTISNNTAASNSGGLNVNGVADASLSTEILITNSTFSGNTAASAGAIRTQTNTELTIVNSTIYNNSASTSVGGLFSHVETETLLHNTIIAGNYRTGGGTYSNDDAQSILNFDAASSHNLVGIDAPSTGLDDGNNGNQIGTTANPLDPMLYDLDDYGGVTLTHAPQAASTAIDAGNDDVLSTFETETSQTNISQNHGSRSDIGSYSMYEGPIIVDLIEDEWGPAPDEPGGISLREAIEIAKQPGPNTILFSEFDFSTPQSIQLVSHGNGIYDHLVLDTEVTIIGPEAPLTVVGVDGSPVFHAGNRWGADATISNLTITGDSDTSLISSVGKNLTLDNVIVTGNANGRGVTNLQGDLTVINSTVSGNNSSENGGGILNWYGTTVIENSTISGNSAVAGGGIYTVRGEEDSLRYAPLFVTNSTISGNVASDKGGGIYTKGSDVTLTNATVAFNKGIGGGIYTREFFGDSISQDYSGSLHADNTIIAKNTLTDGSTPSDVETHPTHSLNFSANSSHNLIGDPNSAGGLSNSLNNIVGDGSGGVIDPTLSTLGDYGGPTQTHKLKIGSPAIEKGDSAFGGSTDQRGRNRIGVTDIGAVEYGVDYALHEFSSDGQSLVIDYSIYDQSLSEVTLEIYRSSDLITPLMTYDMSGLEGTHQTAITANFTNDVAEDYELFALLTHTDSTFTDTESNNNAQYFSGGVFVETDGTVQVHGTSDADVVTYSDGIVALSTGVTQQQANVDPVSNAPTIDLTQYTTSVWTGYEYPTSGTFNVVDANTIEVQNAQIAINLSYSITQFTILEFDFSTSSQGLSHGIAFLNDLSSHEGTASVLDVYPAYEDNPDLTGFVHVEPQYDSSGETQTFRIRVADFIDPASYNYLGFVSEYGSGATAADSVFSNIRLYEAEESLFIRTHGGDDEIISDHSIDQAFAAFGGDGNDWLQGGYGLGSLNGGTDDDTYIQISQSDTYSDLMLDTPSSPSGSLPGITTSALASQTGKIAATSETSITIATVGFPDSSGTDLILEVMGIDIGKDIAVSKNGSVDWQPSPGVTGERDISVSIVDLGGTLSANSLTLNSYAVIEGFDADYDGLIDLTEFNSLGTDGTEFDSDGDLLGDGFEYKYDLDPLDDDEDANGTRDDQDDFDGDGLDNLDEQIYDTDPQEQDTDGDGTNDKDEVDQGSDPNDPTDGGEAPPEDMIVDITLLVGDFSASNSERYDLVVGPINHQATEFGVVESDDYKFRKGKSYPVELIHRGTDPDFLAIWGIPDYDYSADISRAAGETDLIVIEDPDDVLRMNWYAGGNPVIGGPFYPDGKEDVVLHIPLVDIDTDSDNDKKYFEEEEDAAENENTEDGKRIFKNTDDDNKNGKADVDDVKADYTAGAGFSDKDFAEIKLAWSHEGEAAFAGYTLTLTVDAGLGVYTDQQKSLLTQTTWTIDTSGMVDFPETLYIEGKETGTKTVTWTLSGAEGSTSDAIKFRVEEVVWPFENESNFTQTSTDWKGIDVAPAWWTEKTLEDYINGEKGKLATIHPDTEHNGLAGATAEGPDSYSTVSVANGFTLEFKYEFDRSRGENGYVQIIHPTNGPLNKISAVANSGVKFGTHAAGPRTGKDVEASILDVEAMVARGGGLANFMYDDANDTGIKNDGKVDVTNNGIDYLEESLNGLLSGIAYGNNYEDLADAGDDIVDYKNAADDANNDNADGNPAWERYYNTLEANHGRAQTSMKIEVTPVVGVPGKYKVEIWIGAALTYEYDEMAINGLDKFRLQSHWGSGVIFSEMNLTPK